MTPLVDLDAVQLGRMDLEGFKQFARQSGYSRFPVFRDKIVNIIGTIDVFRVLREGETARRLEDFVERPHYVPETKRVDDLLQEFLRLRLKNAVVVNEYGGCSGWIDPMMMKAVLLNQPLVYFAVHARTFWPDRATRENLRQPMPLMGAVSSAQMENKVENWDETNSRLGVRFTMAFDMKLNPSSQEEQPGVMTLRRSFAYLLNLASGVTEKGSQEMVGTMDGKVVQRERLDFVTVGRE